MDNKQLKETLMENARHAGICADGYGLMRGYDRDGLIGYYVSNPDWCLERGYPTLELLHQEFSSIEDQGVFVGRTFDGEVFDKLQTYIFHNCKGEIKVAMDYENAVIPMLYFANGCNMTVSCEQKNIPAISVPLYVTNEGNNIVNHEDNESCTFKVHKIKMVEP